MKRVMMFGVAVMLLLAPVARGDYETDGPVDFGLPALGGGEVRLSDFRGEWVVVNYWATWCAPCRKEIPDLAKMNDEREDITVLGLAYEELEDADFIAFLEDYEVSYPILKVDVYAPPEPFGAPVALPTTIILNKQGRAVKAFIGPVTRESIEQYIDGGQQQQE
jgi:thiol-disulfide isomerase/thioredoxin